LCRRAGISGGEPLSQNSGTDQGDQQEAGAERFGR
jgi:hypothetical protein